MATDKDLLIALANNVSDPAPSAFLQARVTGFDANPDDDDDEFDYFAHSSTMRLIDDNTPTGDDTREEIHFTDLKPTDSNDTNKKEAQEAAQQLIESQKQTIDRLNEQIKGKKMTLRNTINNHEIEMNDLRIEIERLSDENKEITALQAANIKLKQQLAKYENAQKVKITPPKPMKTKSFSHSKVLPPTILKSKSVATGSASIAASLALKLGQKVANVPNKKGAQNKSNPALKKYETMKKIGMPFQSIINKMRMDQCSDALIAEFKGEKIENDVSGIDLNDSKFSKYKKLKKINMPSESIINRMRMDGLAKDEIEAFECEILNGNKRKKGGNKLDKKEELRQLAIEMGLKPKLDVKPQRVKKLKRIHWKIIELKDIKGTIWEKIGKKHTDEEIELGAKFELQFQIRQKKPNKATLRKTRVAGLPNFGDYHSDANKDKKSRNKRKKIQWLDSKRDQMIQIGLKKVGLSNDKIYDAVMDMNESALTLDILETLYELLPSIQEQAKTEEKIETIMNENKDEEDDPLLGCGTSEMFFVELSAIPQVKEQVSKWLFCRTFKEIWSHRMQQTTLMLRGIQAIKRSKALKEYLRILLAMGNLMNHGTDKCMAYGFDLDCLKMLAGIKDFSGKKSLAMFVYEFAYNKHAITHNLEQELGILKQAVRLETNTIEQSVKAINEEFDKIDVLCRKLADDYYNEGDTAAFREYMHEFLSKNKSNMAILKTKLKNAKTLSRSVDKFYGYFELAEDDKPEELFLIIHNFVDTMNKAKDALFKLEKERIKLQKQRQKEREKRMKQRGKKGGKVMKNRDIKPKINKTRLVLKVTASNEPDAKLEEDDDTENNALRNHFRKKTQNLEQQHLDLGLRLSTTLREKKAIANGKLTDSLRNNHIKRKSIMSGSEQYGFGGANMKEIAQLAIKDVP